MKERLAFLQKSDGNLPDDWFSLARDTRSFFRQLAENGNPPRSWAAHALPKQRDDFRVLLETSYPYTGYCVGGWKVEQVAIALYPGFKQTEKRRYTSKKKPLPDWLKGGDSVEDPLIVDEDDNSSSLEQVEVASSPKRTAPQTTSARKKRRLALDVPDILYVSFFTCESY